MEYPCVRRVVSDERNEMYQRLNKEIPVLTAEGIYKTLRRQQMSYQEAQEWSRIFLADDHGFWEVAHRAFEQKTGARGLRAIIEETMMDIMYRVPSEELVDSCTITKDVVDGKGEPVLTYGEKTPVKRVTGNKKMPQKTSGEIA